MKTSLKTRTVALVASILVTTTTAHLIASYALPKQPNTLLALVTPRCCVCCASHSNRP
jgi:hypothetical protein